MRTSFSLCETVAHLRGGAKADGAPDEGYAASGNLRPHLPLRKCPATPPSPVNCAAPSPRPNTSSGSTPRDRRLDGLKFRRQTPIAGYVADLCCLDARLIVELDGGGHAEPEQVVRDAERTQTLEAAGFLVIRFWNNDAMTRTTAVLDAILDSVVAATRRGKG